MLDHNLLKNAREGIKKVAFNPMTEEAQMAAAQQGAAPPPAGAPVDPATGMPMDPAMMGGAPMDPAMMGGAPPMDPAMAGGMPMDPAMMGGAPPMDPAMMDPAMMDPAMMDPAMMGGAPPMEDPAAAGGTPVTLTLEDLQQVVKEMTGEGGEEAEGKSKRATNRQIMDELALVKEQMTALAAGMGIQLPAGEVGLEGDTSTEPTPGSPEDIDTAAAEMAAAGMEAPAEDALAGNPAFDALSAGLPPGEAPPMPKTAMVDWSRTKLG
jgi:hypothetical protein